MNTATYTTEDLVNQEYKYGFVTEIEADTVPRGLNEQIVRNSYCCRAKLTAAAIMTKIFPNKIGNGQRTHGFRSD